MLLLLVSSLCESIRHPDPSEATNNISKHMMKNNIHKRMDGTKKVYFLALGKGLCPSIKIREKACSKNQLFSHFFRVPISKRIAGKKDIHKRTIGKDNISKRMIGKNNISKRMIGTRKRCFPVVIKKCRLFDYHGVKKRFCLYFILQKCWGLD